VNKGLVIGTLIKGTENPVQRIRELAGLGFEGFLSFFGNPWGRWIYLPSPTACGPPVRGSRGPWPQFSIGIR